MQDHDFIQSRPERTTMVRVFRQLDRTLVRAVIGGVGATICTTACLLFATTAAYASRPDGQPRRQIVSYADLDLSRAEGRKTLSLRIRSAARSVCTTPELDSRSRANEARCISEAITRATGEREGARRLRVMRLEASERQTPASLLDQHDPEHEAAARQWYWW